MFKVIEGESSRNFINTLKFISGGSRDEANCYLYTPKSSNLKNVYYLGANEWNNLPPDLRHKSDAKILSKLYKKQLLDLCS